MDWKQRALDLLADLKRYFGQALSEWVESIKVDPVQHFFSLAAGVALGLAILTVF